MDEIKNIIEEKKKRDIIEKTIKEFKEFEIRDHYILAKYKRNKAKGIEWYEISVHPFDMSSPYKFTASNKEKGLEMLKKLKEEFVSEYQEQVEKMLNVKI